MKIIAALKLSEVFLLFLFFWLHFRLELTFIITLLLYHFNYSVIPVIRHHKGL